MSMITEWNPSWKPRSFVTDFDQREISALEQVFPGIEVNLCEFHNEQTWQRWLGAKKSVSQWKDNILKQIRCIARSADEKAYLEQIQKLQSSVAYQLSEPFRNWIEKQWLQECKRWVRCFRNTGLNIPVNTTNGVERQHRILKENYLKIHGFGGTLTSLLTILIKKFLPDMQSRYIQNNVLALETCRAYSEHMPEFLKGRPKNFVTHCLNRMPPIVEEIERNFIKVTEGEPLIFLISSPSGKEYEVKYDSHIPVCSCPDFAKNNWPCKHILAVFTSYPEHGWDSLNSVYTSMVYFNLDHDLINNLDLDKQFPVLASNAAELDSVVLCPPESVSHKKDYLCTDNSEVNHKTGESVEVVKRNSNEERKMCNELFKTVFMQLGMLKFFTS